MKKLFFLFPRRWFGLVGGLALVTSVGAQIDQRLPDLGDGNSMSVQQERRLGESIMRQLWRDPDVMDDPVLTAYVKSIWTALRASAKDLGNLSAELDESYTWDLVLVRDRTVNAFALPGGFMGVHLGLIAVVSNRDELAAVLGHELSHVTQRHIARMQDSQAKQTPWLVGSFLLGVLAASRSPDAANALIMGGTAGVAQGQLNFSRDMEREADRLGFSVTTHAGFDAQGMVSMFQKLAQASRLNDSGGFPYLRTHPLTTERIGDMQARMGAQSASTQSQPGTLEHALMSARARALMSTRAEEIEGLIHTYQQDAPRETNRLRLASMAYAAAMAYAQQRNEAQATQAVAKLQTLVQGDARAERTVRGLAADLQRRAGQPKACVDTLMATDNDRPEVLLKGQCQLALNDAAQTRALIQRLQLWLAQYPRDALAWELVSQAYAQNGQTLQAVRADAESRAVRLDEVAAIDRLRAGQALARQLAQKGPLDLAAQQEASIIDARMRSLEQTRLELLRSR